MMSSAGNKRSFRLFDYQSEDLVTMATRRFYNSLGFLDEDSISLQAPSWPFYKRPGLGSLNTTRLTDITNSKPIRLLLS